LVLGSWDQDETPETPSKPRVLTAQTFLEKVVAFIPSLGFNGPIERAIKPFEIKKPNE
jgi:hypothetical protein